MPTSASWLGAAGLDGLDGLDGVDRLDRVDGVDSVHSATRAVSPQHQAGSFQRSSGVFFSNCPR